MKFIRKTALLALPLAASAWASAARADDRATSQAMFDDATKLMEQKAYDKACPKLEEVVRLEATKIGASLQLARCYEGAGRLASAWARYKAAAGIARTSGDARADEAEAKAAELAPRIPKLTVTVAAGNRGLPDLKIQRDNVDITAAQWDSALPVDPGPHVVVATAAGRKPWRGTVDAVAGAQVAIEVPVLADGQEKPLGPIASADARAPAPTTSAGTPTWVWVTGAGGVVGVGVGVLFGVLAAGSQSDWHALCPGGTCPASVDQTHVNSLASSAHADVAVAGVVGGLGVAAVGVALVGLVTNKPKAADAHGARLLLGPRGVGLAGSF